jgi:hypothetical protein
MKTSYQPVCFPASWLRSLPMVQRVLRHAMLSDTSAHARAPGKAASEGNRKRLRQHLPVLNGEDMTPTSHYLQTNTVKNVFRRVFKHSLNM